MTLATKNGSLIVKNGALAENCGCCGGWYCCPSQDCPSTAIASVSVSIVASDVYSVWPSPPDAPANMDGVRGSLLSGTYSLTKTSAEEWSLLSPTDDLLFLSLAVSGCRYALDIAWRRYVYSDANITVEKLWQFGAAASINGYADDAVLGNVFLPASRVTSGSFLLPTAYPQTAVGSRLVQIDVSIT